MHIDKPSSFSIWL